MECAVSQDSKDDSLEKLSADIKELRTATQLLYLISASDTYTARTSLQISVAAAERA
jgi:hypothetical protein